MKIKEQEAGFVYFSYADLPKHKINDVSKIAGLSLDELDKLKLNGLNEIPCCIDNPINVLKNELVKLSLIKANVVTETDLILYLHSIPGMFLTNKTFLSKIVDETPFIGTQIIPISGQPCAIYHFGVQFALNYLKQKNKQCKVILIGMDIAQSMNSRFYFDSAMGDCITVACIGSNDFKYRILSSASFANIIATKGENSLKGNINRFRMANPSSIRESIEDCLNKATLKLTDIDWIIPHSPYIKMKKIISSVVKVPENKIILDYLSTTGHLNSNDSFCNFVKACEDGKIARNQISLLVNPGFGGTCGSTILINREEKCK